LLFYPSRNSKDFVPIIHTLLFTVIAQSLYQMILVFPLMALIMELLLTVRWVRVHALSR